MRIKIDKKNGVIHVAKKLFKKKKLKEKKSDWFQKALRNLK